MREGIAYQAPYKTTNHGIIRGLLNKSLIALKRFIPHALKTMAPEPVEG
ncbi:MAG: hypothetical protein L6416_00735 [Candidatus Omnitrophica bacterium]|nr:hypothetical protein [Candidatus Omnitrophota bacterium]